MTTAAHRTAAQTAEKAQDWIAAARHWQDAIDAYPTGGALALLDKAKMAARRDAAAGMGR